MYWCAVKTRRHAYLLIMTGVKLNAAIFARPARRRVPMASDRGKF